MAFTEKKLRVTLKLGAENQSFDEQGNNVAVLEGFRVTASVQSGNGSVTPTAKLMIYGVSANIMNRIAKIRWYAEEGKLNFVQLEASSDGGKTYTLVFIGLITFASPNFDSSPEHILTIDATTALHQQLIPVPPVSFEGEVDVAQAISTICQKMNMRFENNGVNAKLSNSYLPQTALEQVKTLCQAANVDLYIDLNTIAITPKGQAREITVPIISPQTGLLGYPTPTLSGVQFRCLFDPAIKFGGLIELKNSYIEVANGMWRVYGLSLFLESQIAGGKWFAEIQGANPVGGLKIAK